MKKNQHRFAPAEPLEIRRRKASRPLARGKGGGKKEGQYFELEKRLRKGGGQHKQKQSEPRRSFGAAGMEGGRVDNEKGRMEYDSSEGDTVSWPVRGFVAPWKMERTGKETDHQTGATAGGAADWQDFEDYEPGYSGHQGGRWLGRSFFPRKNIEGKARRKTLSGSSKKRRRE